MAPLPRPWPGLTGPGRRARWRRSVLRRLLAAACLSGAVLAGLAVVRPPPEPRVPVVVAARAVPAGSVLVAADVTTRPVAATSRQPGAVTDLGAVVGRRIASGLAVGEALTATRLVPRRPDEGLAAGQVALHVVLADPAGADLLAPGRPVSVYPSLGGHALARDARVLAVDPDPPSSGPDLSLGPAAPRGVVLALPAESAERVLAGHGGLEGGLTVSVVARPG